MGTIHPKKRQRAFRLRAEGHSITSAAKECHIAPETIQRLENGYIDKHGVRHRGWKDELEAVRAEQRRAEIECGLALKDERIKVYRQLAEEAVQKIRSQFPSVVMKNPSDYKAIMSEFRELCRMIGQELGGAPEQRGGVKVDITLTDVADAYDAAQEVELDPVTPPRDVEDEPPATAPDPAGDDSAPGSSG